MNYHFYLLDDEESIDSLIVSLSSIGSESKELIHLDSTDVDSTYHQGYETSGFIPKELSAYDKERLVLTRLSHILFFPTLKDWRIGPLPYIYGDDGQVCMQDANFVILGGGITNDNILALELPRNDRLLLHPRLSLELAS